MRGQILRPGKLCLLLCGIFSASNLLAEAAESAKAYRIGYLSSASAASANNDSALNAFRQGLRELGYTEGQNIFIEYRYANGRSEQLSHLAGELARLKVDVIVVRPQPPTIAAAQRATRTIPIFMLGSVVDPVEAGFVTSLANPGGNITGLTNIDSQLHGKRLEVMKEAFPRIFRVAILWPEPQQRQAANAVDAAGKALGVEIHSVIVPVNSGLAGLDRALSEIGRGRPDALLVASSQVIVQHRERVINFAANKQLPAMYAHSEYVIAGGLMSYGTNFNDLHRRAAIYVDKIIKGASAADLPVEQPRKFELIVNLKTAKQIGLTIPPTVLARADKVIR
jgi:putative ABC transport system substrate-binding protein